MVWEGAVPPSQIFFKNFYLKMVSFGAFWVALHVTYLLIYSILKETVVTFRLMCERTRRCVCPSYPNNSSAGHSNSSSRTQKCGFITPCETHVKFCRDHNWSLVLSGNLPKVNVIVIIQTVIQTVNYKDKLFVAF